jgi:hypothetical protein
MENEPAQLEQRPEVSEQKKFNANGATFCSSPAGSGHNPAAAM